MWPAELEDLPSPPGGRVGWPWTELGPIPSDVSNIDWPTISVISPSFNQGKYIEESLRSLLLQRYPKLQIIVMDGGSTDETRAVAEKYRDFIDVFVSEKDNGPTHALNKALARATGQLICWLNTDDYQAPGALFTAARLFASNDSVRWVCGSCEFFSEDDDQHVIKTSLADAHLGHWIFECQVQTPASFWLRSLHDQVGLFDESFSFMMDTDLFLRFILAGIKPTVVPDKLASLRFHSASKSGAEADRFRHEGIKLMVPKYLSSLPPAERLIARRIGAIKLCRMALTAARARRYLESPRWAAQAIAWSPATVLKTVTRRAALALAAILGSRWSNE